MSDVIWKPYKPERSCPLWESCSYGPYEIFISHDEQENTIDWEIDFDVNAPTATGMFIVPQFSLDRAKKLVLIIADELQETELRGRADKVLNNPHTVTVHVSKESVRTVPMVISPIPSNSENDTEIGLEPFPSERIVSKLDGCVEASVPTDDENDK